MASRLSDISSSEVGPASAASAGEGTKGRGLEPTEEIVRQVAEVLDLIRRLRGQGVAIVLVSHRMPDVFAVSDRVMVMRRGRKVADKLIKDSSPEEVTGLITGAIVSAASGTTRTGRQSSGCARRISFLVLSAKVTIPSLHAWRELRRH